MKKQKYNTSFKKQEKNSLGNKGNFNNEIITRYSHEYSQENTERNKDILQANINGSEEESDYANEPYFYDEPKSGPKLVFSRGGKRYGIHSDSLDIEDLISSKGTILYTYEYLIRSPQKRKRKLPHNSIGELQFESRFESGNLQYAIQDDIHNYKLILQNDTNSNSNSLCIFPLFRQIGFYFKVTNMQKNQQVKFTILNVVFFG